MQKSAVHVMCCRFLHVDAACDVLGCCRRSQQDNDKRHSSVIAPTEGAAVADGQLSASWQSCCLLKIVHALLNSRHYAMQHASLKAGEIGGIMQ